MADDITRIRAVAAALRGIRDHISAESHIEYWPTAAYNNAITLLDGAIDNADFAAHELDVAECDANTYLLHLESMIAFLEIYEKETGSTVLSLVPRQKT